jgi:hypothetical protein
MTSKSKVATLIVAAVVVFVALPVLRGQDQPRAEHDQNLMYLRGQAVIPSYEGWHPNPDGTIDIWFGYLNLNWQEELDIPVGRDNYIEGAGYGPDAGQPTHFLPRTNHWQFAIRVPKDFGNKEIVWTLISKGQTHKTYATLKPGYIHDDMGMQREFYGTPPPGNKPPVVTIEGPRQRTTRVGEAITLAAVVTDDGLPAPRGQTADDAGAGAGRARAAGAGGQAGAAQPGRGRISGGQGVGGDSVRGVAKGLRFAWYLYRGPTELGPIPTGAPVNTSRFVVFDPPQFKVWEDQRGGSPWAPSWVNPPIPEGNRWVVRATFKEPGTFVLRGLGSDGLWNTNEPVTIVVNP